VLEVYIKKILFVAPPFTLAQSLGPTPSPLAENHDQNGKHYLVLGVGYVGYANQVGVDKLGLVGVGYVGYPKQTANIANTMQRCARSGLRWVGGCWLCWQF